MSGAPRPVRLSVVIPVRDGADTLPAQLEALAGQRWDQPWEVIVADNGSTDGTADVVRAFTGHVPGLRLVDAAGPATPAYGRNVGAAAASGELLAFADADDVAADGWTAAIAAALEEHEAVASRLVCRDFDGGGVIRGTGQERGLQRLWYPPYLAHAGGCGLGVRREWHERIGGFDVGFPVLQDTDYCIRLQLAGARLAFAPDALVWVRERGDARSVFRQSRQWAAANELLYKMYHPTGTSIPHAWRRFWHEWRHLGRALAHRRLRRGRRLAWELGWKLGLLWGSLRYRTVPVVYPPHWKG